MHAGILLHSDGYSKVEIVLITENSYAPPCSEQESYINWGEWYVAKSYRQIEQQRNKKAITCFQCSFKQVQGRTILTTNMSPITLANFYLAHCAVLGAGWQHHLHCMGCMGVSRGPDWVHQVWILKEGHRVHCQWRHCCPHQRSKACCISKLMCM